MKLARQYFLEKGEPRRTKFISRRQSWHGATLGALSLSGYEFRRQNYEPMLPPVHRVSPCFPYRWQRKGESDDMYVERLKQELEEAFRTVGEDEVCAFVAEPIVGAVS